MIFTKENVFGNKHFYPQNDCFIDGGIDMNKEIKKSTDRIREAVGRMRETAMSPKLAEEYNNILKEIEKIEKEIE